MARRQHVQVYSLPRVSTLLCVLVPCLAAIVARPVKADGGLDPTFGTNGTTIITTPDDMVYFSRLLVDTENRIVVLGENFSGSLRLSRLRADGSLDSSFGTSGLASVALGNINSVSALRQFGNGYVVAVTPASGPALVKLTASGALDTAFGTAGVVSFPDLRGWRVADVRAVSGTTLYLLLLHDGDLPILRSLTATGQPNAAFGVNGEVNIDFGGRNSAAEHNALLPSSAGIVIVGSNVYVGGGDLRVARFTYSGVQDRSFGEEGVAALDGMGPKDALVQQDGGIVIYGVRWLEGTVYRLLASGRPDFAYGNAGLVELTDFYYNNGVITQDSIGRVVGGFYDGIQRLDSNGTVDRALGTNGVLPAPTAEDVAVQGTTLIVLSAGDQGNSAKVSRYLLSATCQATCSASVPGSALVGAAVTFSAVVGGSCAGAVSYSWTFGDGATSTQQSPSHSYASAGTYTWTLTATIGSTSCTKTGQVTISATPTCSLNCSASVPGVATAGVSVSFQASASSSNCTGSPSYRWTFGDGTESALQAPAKTYVSPGTYTWSLTVTQGGQTCSRTGTISVSPAPACTLSCNATVPTAAITGSAIAFQASSSSNCSGSPSYRWTFGDDTESAQQNPTKAYTASKTYSWTLTVSQGGQVCTKSGSIAISPPISAEVYMFEFEASGAYVYSVPFAVNDERRVAETFGQIALDQAAGAAFELLGLGATGYLGAFAKVAEIIGYLWDLTDPVGCAPVGRDLTVANPPRMTVPAASPGVGAVVYLDFIGTPYKLLDVTRIGLPLFLQMYKLGSVSPTRGRSQVLLTSEELRRLDPEYPYRKSYIIVPKTPTNLLEIPYSRWGFDKPSDPYRIVMEASIGSTFKGEAYTEITLDTTGTTTAERTLEAGAPTRINVPNDGTIRRATTVQVKGFDLQSVGPTARALAAACSIEVRARSASSGTILATKTISAEGSQTADLGVLPATPWYLELIAGCQVPVTVVVSAREVGDGAASSVIPIALDVATSTTRYTTEAVLSNRGSTAASVRFTYRPSLTASGAGTASTVLEAGEQRTIRNLLAYLRNAGLAIPDSTVSPSEGGAVRVDFDGASSTEAVSVIARTTAMTASPQPAGAAGLAYAGVPTGAGADVAVLYGLRSNATDRSNLALFNPSASPVNVRVTAYDGAGSGRIAVIAEDLALAPLQWTQYSRVLDSVGMSNAWVTVEKRGGAGAFGAYAVVNDNATNDGSFLLPAEAGQGGTRITVPVLVESSTFRSELVLSNRSSLPATLSLRYVEAQSPSLGAGGTATVTLRAREQLIVPEAIGWLRSRGIAIGPRDAATYVGTLRVVVSGAGLSEVYAGARTAAQSPAGGQFGLFTPGVYEGQEAGEEAHVYGLKSDGANRSNVAVENAGADGSGSVTLELRTFDGDAGGVERGSVQTVSLATGQFKQFNNILAGAGIANGWVRIRRTSGSAPWLAYGVVNDGGQPGQRTGDGAYVPMTTKAGGAPPPPPSDGNEISYTLPGGVPLVMVRIPAGTFQMGAPADERSGDGRERPAHQVTLTQDYYLGKYEVTQAQWQAVMGANPSSFNSCGGNCPVEQVSWDDIRGANGFITKLNQLLGTTKFRLPTEAEWERAARGGTQTRFSFGDALDGGDLCEAKAEANSFMWWCGNADGKSHPVGTKGANQYGLSDMHGNVWEWVEDWFGPYGSAAQTDPYGPTASGGRVFRGGSWYGFLFEARCAKRLFNNPALRFDNVGFRLSRSQ